MKEAVTHGNYVEKHNLLVGKEVKEYLEKLVII